MAFSFLPRWRFWFYLNFTVLLPYVKCTVQIFHIWFFASSSDFLSFLWRSTGFKIDLGNITNSHVAKYKIIKLLNTPLSELTTPVNNVCGKQAQLIALAKLRKTTLGRRRQKKDYTVINFRVEQWTLLLPNKKVSVLRHIILQLPFSS